MPLNDMVMSALTFDKEGLASTARNDDDTGPAMILILLGSLVSFAIAYLNTTSNSVFAAFLPADAVAGALGFAFVDFIITLLMTLVLGFILSIFIKMFGGESGTMNVIRVVGATSIWTTLGYIVSYFSTIGGFVSLIGFIALLFGLSAYSGKGMFVIFIALVLTYIILGILIFLIVFGAILALFSAL